MAETAPQLPSELPVLPLRRTVALPLTLQPLAVNRPVSIETVNRALGVDRLVFLVLQNNENEDPGPDDLLQVGTVGVIRQMAKVPSGINVIIEGLSRARATLVTRTGTSMRAQITPLPETFERTIEVEAHIRRIQELIEKALSLSTGLSEDLRGVVMNIDDPLRLAYVLASLIEMKPSDRQETAGGQRSAEEARDRLGVAHARSLAARSQRQDRVGRAAGDDRRAASVLPAPAAQGHSAGAR